MKKFLPGLLIIITTSLSFPSFSQIPGVKGWTPGFSFSMKRITDTRISPHTKYIAYVVREPVMSEDKSEYRSQIYIYALDGSYNRQFTFGENSCTSPRFSPDGNRLAFLSGRPGTDQIFVMWMNGGEAVQLTHAPASIRSFSWSPDGKKMAFLMSDPETEAEKKEKKGKSDIILAGKNFKYSHIYVTGTLMGEVNDTTMKQITAGNFNVNEFDWSPDGSLIVFSHQTDPEINTGFLNTDISLVPSDSGRIRPLVVREGVDNSPLFSPNGKEIAFCSQGGHSEPVGLSDLYTVSASGGKPRRLTLTPDRNADLIGWSPDGKSLFISEQLGTSKHLLAIRVKGNEMAVVTLNNRPLIGPEKAGTPEESTGTWDKFSISKNLWAMSCTYQETGKPEEVYYSELINFRPRQVSSVCDTVDLPGVAPTKLMRWNSKDGTPIEGLLTYPAEYEKGINYPLILEIHGGPAGAFGQSFTGAPALYQVQDMAREGYAVLRANPRGSTGYGKDFRYANVTDWGYGDFEDLMAGVDKMINEEIADSSRLYVAGWSYGGYLTSFIVSRTKRFRAASMGAGLPDLVSMVYTTDIADYMVAHMGNELWNDYDMYMKHSAMFRLNEITTPLQILHGKDDLRVPASQGEELYTALKRKGVPTELVLYPRTGHVPAEPKLLMDVTPRILKWFENFK